MNKFIAAFDGLKFSESTRDYAIATAKDQKAHLTGVFLDDKTYTSYKIYDLVLEQGVSEQKLKEFREEDNLSRQNAAVNFEHDCMKSSIEYNIHHDKNVALHELLHETIFSDLLIINREESFTHHEEKYPSRFIRDLLSDTQCPVLLVPPKYKEVQKIILLFDGHPTSVYAIKMFNYLFSQFKKLPIEVLSIKPIEENLHLPENKLMKEFIKRHYTNVTYTVLKGISEVEIINYLNDEKLNFMCVLGAYRRTMVSRWFKSSMADALVNAFKSPLFIAHNK